MDNSEIDATAVSVPPVRAVGIWMGLPFHTPWAHQGMTRLVAFLLEGAAKAPGYMFRVLLPNFIRDEAEEDLASIAATIGDHFTIHSPRDVGLVDQTLSDLAAFANAHVEVEGWISLFPFMEEAALLEAPLATLFPDAIPLVFPEFNDAHWTSEGHSVLWREKVGRLLSQSSHVITFGDHVAADQVHKLFGVDRKRIRVIPHAPPDLKDALPFVSKRRRSPVSIGVAAEVLRKHAHARGWHYLQDFPFEEVRYIAVSTQDRVTKNIRIVANAALHLIRQDRVDIKVLMTAQLHQGAGWTGLAGLIDETQTQFDIISVPSLPRDVHAAFYHCAEMAIHPSIFEGGIGTFPFYEAVSVGTPCLSAHGPHVTEFVDAHPDYGAFTFDPNDMNALIRLIADVSERREEVVNRQSLIFDRLATRDWAEVARAYSHAVSDGPDNGNDINEARPTRPKE